MGGEFFQCIKQRSFDHKKAGGVKERFAAVMKGGALSLPQVGEPAASLFPTFLFPSLPMIPPGLQNTPRIQYFDAEDSYILQKADETYWLYIVAH